MEEKDYDHLETVIDVKLKAIREASSLRNVEIDRRLGLLNGEAERLRVMQATYLPRELYAQQHNELKDKIEFITTIANEYRTFKAVMESKASQASVWISYGISIIGIMIGILSIIISVIILAEKLYR